MKQGKLIILSGPSGVGKDTLINQALREVDNFYNVVTATSRQKRTGEIDGVSYHFFTKQEFEEKIFQDYFYEYVISRDDYYGTPKNELDKLAQGINVILNMEVIGAKEMLRLFPDCIRIFVKPESLEQLKKQLTVRGKETPEQIKKRITRAHFELQEATNYDYQITNYYNEPEKAANQLIQILKDLTK